MPVDYPLVGFHFKVEFADLGNEDIDLRFQSVSGLTVDIQTESIKGGGEHRFEYVLPVRTKYSNLILKRGLTKKSALIDWCLDAFQNLIIDPKNLQIHLLNKEHEPLYTWNVVHAWPKKWATSDLNAVGSEVLIETLELQYNYFEVLR
ncbi:MAG: phage tail protein [Bacteroidota bacterium]